MELCLHRCLCIKHNINRKRKDPYFIFDADCFNPILFYLIVKRNNNMLDE